MCLTVEMQNPCFEYAEGTGINSNVSNAASNPLSVQKTWHTRLTVWKCSHAAHESLSYYAQAMYGVNHTNGCVPPSCCYLLESCMRKWRYQQKARYKQQGTSPWMPHVF
jgi:hypothetical protein